MTSQKEDNTTETCPATALLKTLSGKWKPEIFRLALDKPVRFSSLLRDIEGSNKQSLAVALKELEEANLLTKHIISEKPLHIEYQLSENGKAMINVFMQLENL